jgi:ribose 5-phosphate isomerase B
MKIAIGCDHRGHAARERVKALLLGRGYEVLEYGAMNSSSYDYPDAAYPTAAAVKEGRADRGILFCGSGIGMSIVANKVPGIRAALCHDELSAEMARRHNDTNVLCLPADLVGEELMRRIVEVWLQTPFEGGRHARRITKISEYESKACEDAEAAPPKEEGAKGGEEGVEG